MLKTLTVY